CTLSPRFTDLDNWRHVNNSRLYQLHQEARMRLQLDCLGKNSWYSDDVRLRPLRSNTQFRQETSYGEDIQATVTVVSGACVGFRRHSTLHQYGRLVGCQEVTLGAMTRSLRFDLPSATFGELAARLSAEPPSVLDEPGYLYHLHHIHIIPVHYVRTPGFAD